MTPRQKAERGELTTFAAFEDFVAGKPADETFNAQEPEGCVGYQFVASLGLPIASYGLDAWEDQQGDRHLVPSAVSDAIYWALEEGFTRRGRVPFGVLANHLSTLRSRVGK